MRFRDLDLNLLVVLDALLSEENVSRAADRLHLTQPAISSALGRLRHHFKDDLLVKSGRRMIPTPLAERLRLPVNEALLQLRSICDQRPNFNPESATQSFVVVASDYAAATLLADAVVRLETVAPNLTIVSRPLNGRNIDRFIRGEWDLMITPRAPNIPEVHTSLLFQDRYTCIAWSKNASVGNTVTLKQYLSHSHVVIGFDKPTMLSLDEEFLRHGKHERRISAVVPNFTLLPFFVVGTHHLATIHTRLANRLVKNMPLKIVRPQMTFPVVDELLCWHRHKNQDAGNLWLRNFLVETASSLHKSDRHLARTR